MTNKEYQNTSNEDVRQKLHEIMQGYPKVKLHLGCGAKYFNGWINIDAKEEEFPGDNSNKVDIIYNLTKLLPIENESVDFIFHDNFFEHLTFEDGLALLTDHYRVLKKGGVVRINQPDLETITKLYINDSFEDLMIDNRTYREHYSKERWGIDVNRNRCESINYCFRQVGQHKFLYDYEEMKLRLVEAGFKEVNIKRCNTTESDFIELQNLEGKGQTNLKEGLLSLVVEAIK
ncbi:class I SAM-dependent methyltransferase [Rickettsiales bacterium LUAb2]